MWINMWINLPRLDLGRGDDAVEDHDCKRHQPVEANVTPERL